MTYQEETTADQTLTLQAPQSDHLKLLYRLGQYIAGSVDVKSIAERALHEICTTLQTPRASILILKSDSKTLSLVSSVGLEPETEAYLAENFRPGVGLAGWVVANRQAAVVDDVREDLRWLTIPSETLDLRAALCVPLIHKEKAIGALTLSHTIPGYFETDHAELVKSAATLIAMALVNAQLLAAERRQHRFTEALVQAAAVVNNVLDAEQVLDRILEQVAKVVHADSYNVLLIEEGVGRMVRWRGYETLGMSDEQIAQTRMELCNYPTFCQMLEAGEPLLITDTSTNPAWKEERPSDRKHRSYVAAPIKIGDEIVGFLNANGLAPSQFTWEDALRLQAFADHAAVALHNAQLYQEKLRDAQELEQRVAERTVELNKRTAWAEAILRSTSDGIIVADGYGRIIQYNPVAAHWLKETLSAKDAARLQNAIRQCACNAPDHELCALELTGLDLELQAAPVRALTEDETAIVVAIHDVTHLKALQRMKNQFISNISHELRTPITSIRLFSSLIQNSPQERWSEYFHSLDAEALRLEKLVDGILQISRIEAGRMELRTRSLDLNVLAAAAVASHVVIAENKGLELHYLATDNPIPIRVDVEKFNQVLNNLIENAINYTMEGHIKVVSREKQQQGRTWATVSVCDTGLGIPVAEMPHIFERFFRGERPRTLHIPGSGLGLAIVKEIVELHGGHIVVQSEVDQGSTFTIWMPLATNCP